MSREAAVYCNYLIFTQFEFVRNNISTLLSKFMSIYHKLHRVCAYRAKFWKRARSYDVAQPNNPNSHVTVSDRTSNKMQIELQPLPVQLGDRRAIKHLFIHMYTVMKFIGQRAKVLPEYLWILILNGRPVQKSRSTHAQLKHVALAN